MDSSCGTGGSTPLEAFWEVAWATLGWRLGSKDFLLAKLSVRLGTALQLRHSMQPRRDKQLAFQELAHRTISGAATAANNASSPQSRVAAIGELR